MFALVYLSGFINLIGITLKLFFGVILFCFTVLSVAAQSRNTLRDFKIHAGIREQLLDTLSIVQHSFAIFDPDNNPLEKVFYQIDFVNAKIVLTIPEEWKDDSLRVTYEVWPLNFAAPVFIRDATNITPTLPGEDRVAARIAPSVPGHGLLREGLQSSGSISRGLTMGNRQDVTIRSDMNLQMSGMLTENIEILAAISDQDIPFQPDGYTQQIQDFDRVFIQLSTPQTRVIAGDFDMGRPSGNFMNFTRKARGATISHTSETETGSLFGQGQVRTTASAAISRGNYARNIIAGIEGNQGPYRLEGNNNESFIMILAGSERVYVDGVRMMRGMQGDYVIDYNMAEITFTASRLITRNSRIVIEFEYAERNFARSVLFSGTEVRYDNAHFWFNFFSEQDHRNQSLFQELSDDRRALMTAAGDSLRQVFDWNVDSTGFQNDRVMYRLTDTLGFDSVFVFSTDPILAVYQPRFAWVGQGNGNYRQIRSAANGKVFQWVEPQNGVPQGTHEPTVLLVTPKSHQMVTAGGKFSIAPTTSLNFEYGFSNQDINLFSNLHENDNRGHAMKIGITDTRGALGDDEEGWRYITRASWETAGHTFKPLERYRGVEFERNWNLIELTGNDTEHLPELSFAAQHPTHGQFNYSFSALLRGEGYNGIMNAIDSRINIENNRFEYNGRLLNSGGIRETMFYRHNSLIARDKRLFTIGMGHQMESNKFFLPDSPVLTHGSNSFSEWEVFLSNPVESRNQYRLFYRLREDHIPILQSFESASRSSDIGAKFQYLDNPDQRIGVQIIYRRLNLLREMMPDNNVGRTLNTRVDYTSRWANGAITSNLFYEASSQRTQRREFIYVEVPAGQGVFVWNDYDGNNLMELDEFEIAPFPDEANFVRVFVPTRDFVPVYTNTFSQSLIIDPAVQWRDQYGIRGLLARFSNRFNYRIDNKRMGGLATENFNPFHGNMNDTSLISMNSTLRNSLAFNRTNPVFTIEWIWQSNRNKQLLSNGFESLLSEVHSIRGRWSITRQYSLNLTGTLGDSETNSEFFANRNFRIESKELEPTLSYQHGANLRINIFYGWGTRENVAGGLSEGARQHKSGIEVRFSMPLRGNIQARYELAKIEFPHPQNTPVAFKILQGLRAGTNHIWNVNWQHNLNRFLQISLIYNGRLPTGLAAIHTGTVQVRALF